MDTLNAFFYDQKALSRETSYHLNYAIRNVSARLGVSNQLDESSLLVVNFMLVQSLVQESEAGAVAHRNGLKQMVKLAGGLSEIDMTRTLLLKIHRYFIELPPPRIYD